MLFVLFINDIDDVSLSKISKFVDDTKLCIAVSDDEEADILHEDLRRMFRFSSFTITITITTGKCCSIWKSAQLCTSEMIGMESIPEAEHGKTGESAKKSHKNDPGLYGFEL